MFQKRNLAAFIQSCFRRDQPATASAFLSCFGISIALLSLSARPFLFTSSSSPSLLVLLSPAKHIHPDPIMIVSAARLSFSLTFLPLLLSSLSVHRRRRSSRHAVRLRLVSESQADCLATDMHFGCCCSYRDPLLLPCPCSSPVSSSRGRGRGRGRGR